MTALAAKRHSIRHLDVDDFFVLKYLGEGKSMVEIAKILLVTQPAISQRVERIEEVFGDIIVTKKGRRVVLTDFGKHVTNTITTALKIVMETHHELH